MAKKITGNLADLADGSTVALEADEVQCAYCKIVVKLDSKGFAVCPNGHGFAPKNTLHPNGAWFPKAHDAGWEWPTGAIRLNDHGQPDPNGNVDKEKNAAYRWPL